MSNIPSQYQGLPGFKTVYDESVLAQAIAFAEVTSLINGGTGSGGAQRTPNLFFKTDSGTIPSGYQSVAVYNAGTSAGLVKGVSFPPGASVNWSVEGTSDTIGAIAYDATGTSLLFATLG